MKRHVTSTTATDMWQAFQSQLSPISTNSSSFIEHKDPAYKKERADKRKELQELMQNPRKRQKFGAPQKKQRQTGSPPPNSSKSSNTTARLGFSGQPEFSQKSDVTTGDYFRNSFRGFQSSFPVAKSDRVDPINMQTIQLVTSQRHHKTERVMTPGAQKTRRRKKKTLTFRFQGQESFHHPLTKIVSKVHVLVKAPDGGPALKVSAKQVKSLCEEVLTNPAFVVAGPGFSQNYGQEQVAQLQLRNRKLPVVLRSSEYQSAPVNETSRNLPPFSEPQALYFWTQTQLLDKESRMLLLKTFSVFLSLDESFQVVLAFAGCLKPSSRRTYTSSIRMFIQALQSLYPGKFESLHPFTLLKLIRGGQVTRAHVRAVLTYRRLADEIDLSTFNVTVSAVKFAWKQACLEDLIRPQDFQLSSTIKSLRKAFQSSPQGGDVFTQKELHEFFRISAEIAESPQEKLWALTFCWASRFMLRRSEIINLQRNHVHIHQEPLDFELQDMITVELIENKTYMYRTQSVSYFLCESTGPYDPKQLCEAISQCHIQGQHSEWFASTTARLSERQYFKFFNKCVEQFKEKFSAYAKKRFVFHSLRASEIVHLFNRGVQIDVIRQKARHAQWSTTFGSYASKALRFTRPSDL